MIQTPGNGDVKTVIYNIYGKEIADNLINIDYTYEDILVKGVIGKPVISRSNRSNQLFFVNERYVKDKTLSGAAEQAFKGFVTIGKHGFLVLDITMDPRKVDVNVHPAKLEVRFQEETKIFKAIYHSIRDGLTKGDLVADTNSIEMLDSERGKYNQKIENNTNYEIKSNTSFRDIIKQNIEHPKMVVTEAKEEYGKETAQPTETEKNNEETFESVMERLKKMQNMIDVANQSEKMK